MKNILLLLTLITTNLVLSQDITMQNGAFNQCSGMFYDSGTQYANYGSDENLVTTICSDVVGDFIQLDFTPFFFIGTDGDEMRIYDGDDISAPLIDTYTGGTGPGMVSASSANSSGCLTVEFISNSAGTQPGWEANITCFTPCQDITASIDNTTPAAALGVIEVDPGDLITFEGSAIFSDDDTGATYTWDFGNGDTIEGLNVNYAYAVPGTYTVTFTATDTNPLGCSDSDSSIQVFVIDNDACVGALPICDGIVDVPSLVGDSVAQPGIEYDCLTSQPNPRWYFIQTGDVVGNIELTLTQNTGINGSGGLLDVDFIIWGPFDQPECGPSNLNPTNQQDCSYSGSGEEDIFVANAPANSYYVLLITNYSGQAGYINLENTNPNPGLALNCDIICQVDLGDDQNLCSGGDYTITADSTGAFNTFEWQLDGVTIPGETSPTLTVTESGTYTLIAEGFDAVYGDACSAQDDIVISIGEPFVLNDITVLGCSGTATSADFNLNDEITNILSPLNVDDYVVYFHENLNDAENNTAPISNTDSYNGIDGEIIFARVEVAGAAACYSTSTVTLSIAEAPSINSASDMFTCDDVSNNGFESFELSDQTATILGSQAAADFTVSYYLTPEDAESGDNALPLTYTNSVNSQPIYARVESSSNSNCYNASATPLFNLVVNIRALATAPIDLELCDDIGGDGIETFNLSNQEAVILGGQDASVYNVTFHSSQDDANTNTDALPTSYTNTSSPNQQTIYVRVEDPLFSDCYGTTNFDVIVNPLPTLIDPTALEVCDDGTPDGLTAMDLSLKDSEITGNNPAYAVTYHELATEAVSGTNALPTLYTNTSNGQIVYVRVEDTATECYSTTSLELTVEQAPIANTPQPLIYCDPDNDGLGLFVLTDLDDEITGSDPGLEVTYHETEINANNGVNAIDTSVDYENINPNGAIIYARIESPTIATDCAVIVVVELIVEPSPQIEDPTALEFCEDLGSSDGYISFDLTAKAPEILNGQNPIQYEVSYYSNESDGEAGTNAIVNPSAYTNTTAFNQIIWVRVEDTTTIEGCYKITSLELIVNALPEAIQPTELNLCDDLGEMPGDNFTVFDLTVKDDEIIGDNASWSVAYYETNADAQSQTNVIADPTQYTNTSVGGLDANPQTLYAVVTDTDTGCVDYVTLTIRVLPNPTPALSEDIPNIELCDDVNTGDGVEVFDLTANETLILNGEAGVTATYYERLQDANAGTNAIADPTQYTNIGTPEQEIYVRVTRNSTGCYSLVDFTIIVHPLPSVVAVTDFIQCELFTDGIDNFDLTTKDDEVLNGQNPTQFIVSYHSSLVDAESGMNAIVGPYANTSNPQQIFVTITDNTTGCSISTQSFNVEVHEAAQANSDTDAILYELCDDEMEIDGDPSNDSVQFDLATMDAEVLDLQNSADYIVTYYETQEEADLKVNPLPTLYENIVNPQVIYARVDNDIPDPVTGADTSICYAVAELTLQVNALPEFDLDDRYVLCINTNDTEALAPLVIDTYLSAVDYSFVWYFNDVEMAGETGASLIPLEEGNYSVEVTDLNTSTETNCTHSDSTEVIESEPPSITIELLTQAFADRHVLEATAIGIGIYEYSLDGGPWQDEGVFTGVSSGDHEITARDKNGCGLRSSSKFVIDYPLFFTPNGVGNNETWNIEGVGSSAKIYIFDRYGKLLKQLSPDGDGWDGQFNGEAMPTDGYWFTVEYDEPSTGERKEFKAHFSLKR
ncbi:T9SS type B sorting domain-containing protein [Winogradskyella wichelsiae]|uniref:T9SS type B sorting domain-containing protein n=1 Tax=Winogradskyella wichelsiae TaxID=2697007 RepID=UPI0015CB20A6|nr:T9SS type B sorting domain-containing protein [Winogradskyella wichelsiae]